jgi:uncharacterized protein (TIGR02145 family)
MKTSFILLVLLLVISNAGAQGKGTTIKIGTQTWMKKNLDVTRYRNGDPIPQVTDSVLWTALTTGAYCYFENDSATYAATYGKLYNWYAVNDPRGLAPAGWHVPSDVEWTTLTLFLGGDSVAGGKLKETGLIHWRTPNKQATNTTGFTALPGGIRTNNGSFRTTGLYCQLWSSKGFGTTRAYFRSLNSISARINRDYCAKEFAFYVRCVKN